MRILTDDILLELIEAVQDGVARRGFHILSRQELQTLWESEGHRSARLLRIHHFARACGARCETDLDLSMARFLPTREKELCEDFPIGQVSSPRVSSW